MTGAALPGVTDSESAKADSRYVSSVFDIALRITRQRCRMSVLAVVEEVALAECTRWLAKHRLEPCQHQPGAVAHWIASKAISVAAGRRRGDRGSQPIPRASRLDALVNAQNNVPGHEHPLLAPVGDDHVTRAILDLPDHRDLENAVIEALDAQNEVRQLPPGDWQADLLHLLKSRKWSLGEVAAALVVTRSAVANWRDGRGRPSKGRRATLRGLAESGLPPPKPLPKARYGHDKGLPIVVPGTAPHRQRLAELRAAGWTIDALARALEVCPGTVLRWCAGDHPPRAHNLAALVALLDRQPPVRQGSHAGQETSAQHAS